MNSIGIDASVQNIVSDFLKYQALETAALEREDVHAGNQQFDKMFAALKQLATSPRGRDALEYLMDHETPEVRLRAAGQAMAWAPEKAIPVLGRLVAEWRPRDPHKGYVAVGLSASGRLYDFFGIKDFDRSKLIQPLRAYGIDLPPRPE